MVRTTTDVCDFGAKAPDFSLKGTDEKTYTLKDCMGENGLLVMFICNHCPYVIAIRQRIIRDCSQLADYGIGSVAIMSNDTENYPDDSFENMQKIAKQFNYPFPYLIDTTQQVAKSYGAVCTPDFFGYNKDFKLQYRGQLDDSRKEQVDGANRDLFEAMKLISKTGNGPRDQFPSMGCSIKWR